MIYLVLLYIHILDLICYYFGLSLRNRGFLQMISIHNCVIRFGVIVCIMNLVMVAHILEINADVS